MLSEFVLIDKDIRRERVEEIQVTPWSSRSQNQVIENIPAYFVRIEVKFVENKK